MADHIGGRNVEEGRDRDASLAVLLRRDDRGGGGAALADHVDVQLDRAGADHHRTREHRIHRPHRLLRKPFGHSDNRLRQHLRAFDDLSFVLAGGPGLGDESVLSIGRHVEQVEQPLNGPRRLR